jgi:Restriction endonuclease
LGSAGDKGVDILLTGGNETIAVQCKNYAKPVGNRPVQEVYVGMGYHRASVGWVVAPAGYTRGAHKLANRLGVKLYDASAIKSWIQKVDALETERATRQQATRVTTRPTPGAGTTQTQTMGTPKWVRRRGWPWILLLLLLVPEERHRVYKLFKLRVNSSTNGALDVSGALGDVGETCKTETTSR